MSTFFRLLTWFPRWLHHLTSPPATQEGAGSPHPHRDPVSSDTLILPVLADAQWYLTVVRIYIHLIIIIVLSILPHVYWPFRTPSLGGFFYLNLLPVFNRAIHLSTEL